MNFQSQVLSSTHDGDTPYHDDFLGESVWINVTVNPFQSDWREFNGIKIKDMSKILLDWENNYQGKVIDLCIQMKKVREENETPS